MPGLVVLALELLKAPRDPEDDDVELSRKDGPR